ncbi:NINE protein [Roseimaritima sediminicola]|uniref:NINE protein n=1 Tax=Roseimaritima sediminicola TaxID=2662066 RepID=UPI00129842FE|nr:TM2 domain-containing protein [Roseimaritima sediminicola]
MAGQTPGARHEIEPAGFEHESHLVVMGYVLWIVGFTGAHRFYYGRQLTGTLWFFTGGLLGVGWLIDVFLIPGMNRSADLRYTQGPYDYSLGWILLTFLGLFGVHRFYLGKWLTGLLYLVSGGLFGVGWLYDLWTLNEQISLKNLRG